ncbi:hypothetical protein Vretifemale_7584, partial [Volvox reticuliferus]
LSEPKAPRKFSPFTPLTQMRPNSLLFAAVVVGWFAGSHALSCEVCVNALLSPPDNDIRPYRFDGVTCSKFQSTVARHLNTLTDDDGVEHQLAFTPDDTLCEPLKLSICADVSSSETMGLLQKALNALAPIFQSSVADGDLCHPKFDNYGLIVTVDSCDDSLDQPPNLAKACSPLESPGINCTCDTTKFTTPFLISGSYTEEPSERTTLYCFDVLVDEASPPSTCSGGDILRKVEIYADMTLKTYVKSFRIFPAVGAVTIASPSWGPTGSNVLKTSLYWTKEQANGASFCVEVKKPVTMIDLCGGRRCFVYLTNPGFECCPMYAAGP